MSDPSSHFDGTLHEIRWTEICPWLILVKALRVTLMIRVLLLATVGMLLTLWGEAAIDRVLSDKVSPLAQRAMPKIASQFGKSDHCQPGSTPPSRSPTDVFQEGWEWSTKPFLLLLDTKLSLNSSLILLLRGVWRIVVWGIFGGAIARIAARHMTRGVTIGPMLALREATTVWTGTAGAPLIALFVAGGLGIPLVLLGSLFRFQVVALVAGVLWCLVLAVGLMLAVVLLGVLVGWPLMWACQSVERSDAFDGVSRCYAYVYQRPLHLAFYVLIASLLASLGKLVVDLFATTTVTLSEGFFLAGTSSSGLAELLSPDPTLLGSQTIRVWKWAFTSLVDAYPLACLWPMAVGIYLLLRRQVDATEMDEITLSSAAQSLPPRDPTAHE